MILEAREAVFGSSGGHFGGFNKGLIGFNMGLIGV